MFGHNWKKIERYMGTRTEKQIISRAVKHLGVTMAEAKAQS